MNKYLKFVFKGGTYIDEFSPENEITIDCPNKQNGIGNITFSNANQIWANGWFKAKKFGTQLSDLLEIYAVSLCEEDAPILLWKKDSKIEKKSKFYPYWYATAQEIKILCNKVRIQNTLNSLYERKQQDE